MPPKRDATRNDGETHDGDADQAGAMEDLRQQLRRAREENRQLATENGELIQVARHNEEMANHNQAMQQRNGEMPMPRQMCFNGRTSWESFLTPFERVARACRWSAEDMLFRLTSSLRDEAAEYAFCHIPPEALNSYAALVLALEARFKEKRPIASYLAQLETRRLQTKENVSEFSADIRKLVMKSYPTADERTRETIGVRHFLKGLGDHQTSIAVGMRDPQTIEEARAAYETYGSLRDDAARPSRVRAVTIEEDDYVTKKELKSFGEDLVQGITAKFDSALAGMANRRKNKIPRSQIECYNCHEKGHYASECPAKKAEQEN